MANANRVALITGCGKPIGIGASTARTLAAAGITVVVTDVAPSGLANEHNVQGDVDPSWRGVASLVEQIETAGGQASSAIGDVSQEADARRMVDTVMARYGRLDILVNNAGRGMKYVSTEFLTEPTRLQGSRTGNVAPGDRHQRERPFHDGKTRGSRDAEGGLGTDRQCFGEPSDHAPPRLFSLWSFEGGTRIGDDHLGAGSRGHGCYRERPTARRSYPYRHDPADRVGKSEISAARSFDHGPTVALARVAGSRWDDGPSFGGDQMADW